MENKKEWDQFFTPVWVSEILFNAHFSHLTEKDVVWEPTCGQGSWLSVVPKHITAIGSEIDPELVKVASENTGRQVHHGDFRRIQFDGLSDITAIIGNPPFKLVLFEQFMQRCENILRIGNKAGFILPAYFFQTSKTFVRFQRRWSIAQEMIPRDIFQTEGLLSKPLMFATFIRENSPHVYGFRLYIEMSEMKDINDEVMDILKNKIKRNGSVWRETLIHVVKGVGGTATLDEVYRKMERKRPTENPFWKEQVRKIIQQHPFERVDNAKYKLVA